MPSKRQPSHPARTQQLLRPVCLACATALAVCAPLVPSERTELTGAALPATMLWLLTALIWFAGAWLLRQPVPRWNWVDAAAFALVAWIGASGVAMMQLGSPRLTLNAVWTWVGMGAALLVFRQLLRGEQERRALCAVFIGLAMCLSLVALHQTFIAFPQARALYESDPDRALQLAGVDAAAGSMQRKQFESRLYSTEPYATFSLTNSLAGFVGPWLVLLVGVASSRRIFIAHERTRRLEALTTWLIAVPLVICLLLTKSRSAWLATLLGLIAITVVRTVFGGHRPAGSQRLAMIAVISLVALASALLAAIGIFDINIVAQAGRSLAFRWEYWQATLAMITDYPLLGIGVGNFQEYYTAYKLPQASETIADPHNFLLEIASNAGVPALIPFIALLVASAVVAWRRRREGEAPAEPGSGKTHRHRGEAKPIGSTEASPSQTTRAIYAGGVVGVPLAILLGLVTGYMPDVGPLLLGAVGGAIAVWLLHGWVEQGTLPRWAIVVAIGVLLVNLLAAGGISFPGVAITLWILLTIACPDSPVENSVGRWPSAMGAVVSATLLLACHATAYQPVLARLRLAAAISDAQQAGNLAAAIDWAQQAAAADRWSTEPQQQLTQLHFEQWLADDSPTTTDADFKAFETHAVAALARNRRSFPLASAVSFMNWEAFQRTNEPRLRDAALQLAARAVELYPHDAMTRAQWAWLLAAAGRTSDAEREAAEALRLDALCPHAERKLAERPLFTEVTSPQQQARMPAELRTLDAEQWMLRWRKK